MSVVVSGQTGRATGIATRNRTRFLGSESSGNSKAYECAYTSRIQPYTPQVEPSAIPPSTRTGRRPPTMSIRSVEEIVALLG